MRTAWGYEVSDKVEPIITVTQFNEMTGGAYAGNPRVESAINAAAQAVRNYCGWHICPSMECTAYPVGEGKLLRLPAAYVSSVDSVVEDGVELTTGQYEWRRDGLMRRSCFRNWSNSWSGIEVTYQAGFDIEAVPDLAEAICSIASGVLAVAPGVTSESADGVSISYSASASSIAASLTIAQKSALAPYKVVNSHAA
jgi:hypothetical protein